MSMQRIKRSKHRAPPPVAPSGPPSLGHLHAYPQPLQRIANALVGQLSPLYDRRDLLRDAASLACAGSKGTTALARLLFKHLSPHLGQPLPNGVTAASNTGPLQVAAQRWGLKMSGSKQEIYQRILDEAQDSEPNPWYCLVSAATRRELSAWEEQRISAAKAKELFGLERAELERSLEAEWAKAGEHNRKSYRLVDCKRLALEIGFIRPLVPQPRAPPRQQSQGQQQQAAGASNTAAAAPPLSGELRAAALRRVLLGRGHAAAMVEVMLEQPGAFRVLEEGYAESGLPPEAAASLPERWQFFVRGPAAPQFMAALAAEADWEPPPSSGPTAAADAAHARRQRAMNAALPQWLAAQRNLMFILGNPEVPRSMLPELQHLWEERQQG